EAVLRRANEVKPSDALAFELADNLILQDKIDGKDQARDYLARLGRAGLGETLGAYLEARILFPRKQWPEAIRRIEEARGGLVSDHRLTGQLNLMLAQCYARVGSDEQGLDALGRVAEGDPGPEPARIAYARALERSGKLYQALEILLPMAGH